MTISNRDILVIDDELQIRKLLQITLQSNGFQVIQAGTAKEGMALAAQKSPGLILLDLGLPDENGHDTLRKLREWSKTPLIVLSVQNNEADIIRALDNGANDYLVKPFRTGELLARIRTALREVPREDNNHVIRFAGIEVDVSNHTVKVNGIMVSLTGICGAAPEKNSAGSPGNGAYRYCIGCRLSFCGGRIRINAVQKINSIK